MNSVLKTVYKEKTNQLWNCCYFIPSLLPKKKLISELYVPQNGAINKIQGLYHDCRTCSRKKIVSIFVKWDRHDPVSEVKCFLHSVSMVDIYIYIENTRMVSEKYFKNDKNL